MLTTRMKSQPQYPPLEWDRNGRQHIVFVSAEDQFAVGRKIPTPHHIICLAFPSASVPDANRERHLG